MRAIDDMCSPWLRNFTYSENRDGNERERARDRERERKLEAVETVFVKVFGRLRLELLTNAHAGTRGKYIFARLSDFTNFDTNWFKKKRKTRQRESNSWML